MKLRRELGDLPFGDSLTTHDGALEDEGHYDGILFEGQSLEDSNADHSRFVECAFADVTMDNVALRKSRLSDVWLRDVRLLSADLAGSSWLDATIIGCSGAGIQAFDAAFQRVGFSACKLDSWNFGGAKLKRVTFGGCVLTRADFSRATLDKADLRGAELDITAGYESLRGAIMTTGQLISLAPAVAPQIGITINAS